MAYYNHIANQWCRITGFKQGARPERPPAGWLDIHEKYILETAEDKPTSWQ